MGFYPYLILLFFCFSKVSLTKIQNHGFTMELIHPFSSRSPFYNTTETQLQRVSNVINHSINRVHHLNNMFSLSSNNSQEITITPYMGYGYAISYAIGTPPFQQYGVMDTGSETIWFQCKPCNPCFNQTSPIFDPSKSSTYKIIPCSSPICKNVGTGHCSSNITKNCEYNFSYFDHSNSQGDISVDTLTLKSNNDSFISFPKIVIGCGHKNKVSFGGSASGIIGLGRGPLSFNSQLSSSIGNKFSYCLVPLYLKGNITSKLNLGNTSMVSSPETVSTPIEHTLYDSGYLTTLEAFSVGDLIIKLEHSSASQGNAFVDSGSTLTMVPTDVYSKLESIVESKINLKRVKDPTQQLSLCYQTTIKNLEVPIITAHFRGADVKLNALNTFIEMSNEVVCFAFGSFGNSPLAVFGNVAQQNFLVGFDNINNVVSFTPTDCTKQLIHP